MAARLIAIAGSRTPRQAAVRWRSGARGLFFQGVTPPTRPADPLSSDILIEQVLPTASDRMRIEAEKRCQLGVSAVAQPERLQARVESSLLFVEQTVKQEDGCPQLGGRDQQCRRVDCQRDCVGGAASLELSS